MRKQARCPEVAPPIWAGRESCSNLAASCPWGQSLAWVPGHKLLGVSVIQIQVGEQHHHGLQCPEAAQTAASEDSAQSWLGCGEAGYLR